MGVPGRDLSMIGRLRVRFGMEVEGVPAPVANYGEVKALVIDVGKTKVIDSDV